MGLETKALILDIYWFYLFFFALRTFLLMLKFYLTGVSYLHLCKSFENLAKNKFLINPHYLAYLEHHFDQTFLFVGWEHTVSATESFPIRFTQVDAATTKR